MTNQCRECQSTPADPQLCRCEAPKKKRQCFMCPELCRIFHSKLFVLLFVIIILLAVSAVYFEQTSGGCREDGETNTDGEPSYSTQSKKKGGCRRGIVINVFDKQCIPQPLSELSTRSATTMSKQDLPQSQTKTKAHKPCTCFKAEPEKPPESKKHKCHRIATQTSSANKVSLTFTNPKIQFLILLAALGALLIVLYNKCSSKQRRRQQQEQCQQQDQPQQQICQQCLQQQQVCLKCQLQSKCNQDQGTQKREKSKKIGVVCIEEIPPPKDGGCKKKGLIIRVKEDDC